MRIYRIFTRVYHFSKHIIETVTRKYLQFYGGIWDFITEAYKVTHISTPGGYLVERWVRGCVAQIGCFFGLSGFAMAPFLFENWFRYRSRFCKMHNFR